MSVDTSTAILRVFLCSVQAPMRDENGEILHESTGEIGDNGDVKTRVKVVVHPINEVVALTPEFAAEIDALNAKNPQSPIARIPDEREIALWRLANGQFVEKGV